MAHRLAPQAAAALDDIWQGLASERGNFAAADQIIDEITSRFWLLARYPHIGRERHDLRVGLRSFAVGHYVIFYRIDARDVLILHILHGRRDITTALGDV